MFAKRKGLEVNVMQGGYPDGDQPEISSLKLACGANEQLPSCPELPADVFTSWLTSSIDIALGYFIMNHQLPNNITADIVLQLLGDLKDRRIPLGELNGVFTATAITDTMAWTTFSRDIFTKLYRCDLLIASLFRNSLLAERIMKNYHLTPHTFPPLPSTNARPLWALWDLAVDACLRQLPDLLSMSDSNVAKPNGSSLSTVGTRPGPIGQTVRQDPNAASSSKLGDKPYVYVSSRFFANHLTAFEV
jgi:regulator-associated protein of mTOR